MRKEFEKHFQQKSLVSTPNSPQQPLIVNELKKCKLAVNDEDGNLLVVAEATSHPTHDGVVHTSQALCDHYKVTIDKIFKEHGSILLPVPPEENITKLNEADQYFILWPMSLVIFEDSDHQTYSPKKITNSKSKERADSWDPKMEESNVYAHKHTVVKIDECLTEECLLLHLLLDEENIDNFCVPLKSPSMYSHTDTNVWVTHTDISEFLRGASLNVSIIHVYILCLMEEFISSMKGRNVTFLCPQRISAAECTRSFFDALKYVKEAFHTELKMKEEHCKFILAPYNENNHWILIVIDLRAGVMLHFDPLAQQCPRELSCAQAFKYAYKQYIAKIKPCDMPNNIVDFVAKQMECPQPTKWWD